MGAQSPFQKSLKDPGTLLAIPMRRKAMEWKRKCVIEIHADKRNCILLCPLKSEHFG
jgi:hypothetical protein